MKEVNPTVIERGLELREQYLANQPFRHVVIDDFLEREFCRALLDQFPAFDEKTAINENKQVGRKSTQERVAGLGPAYAALDRLVRGGEFRGLVSTITGIDDLLYDPDYIGGGTHENLSGQDLDPHVDFNFHPLTNHHRRLNLIIYLNEQWREEWGGCLDLHLDPYRPPAEDTITRVLPEFNRCVIFETTEKSWHGFERIDLPPEQAHRSRKSFALYYYTEQRPAEETGPPHSTIYVDRHLPEDIRAGEVLTEAQLQQIRILLTRRDHHIKRLYRTVEHLGQQAQPLRELRTSVYGGPLGGVARLLRRALKR